MLWSPEELLQPAELRPMHGWMPPGLLLLVACARQLWSACHAACLSCHMGTCHAALQLAIPKVNPLITGCAWQGPHRRGPAHPGSLHQLAVNILQESSDQGKPEVHLHAPGRLSC